MSRGLTPSAGTDRVRQSQSMLSMLVLCRFKAEGCVFSLKSTSMVTKGECSSSISFSVCVSVPAPSVLSRSVSSWVSGVKAAKLLEGSSGAAGSWATWTRGGGRDKTVLMGRVVTLAVTGRGLSGLGWSCLMKGEISKKTSENPKMISTLCVIYQCPPKREVFLTAAFDQHIKQIIHLLAGCRGTLQKNKQ